MKDIDGPRACRLEELEELLELVNFVFRTSSGRLPTIATDYPHIYRESNLENVRVIGVDGTLRASLGTWSMQIALGDVRLNTLGVNAVTTHPDWRGRGFGELLMRDVEGRAQRAGCDLIHLSAGVPEWYRKLDYEDGGCQLTYTLNRGNVGFLPGADELEIDSGLERYLEDLHRIHTNDQLGAVREPDDLPLVLGRTSPHLYVAKRGGNVEAYVLVREAEKLVIEHGGAADLVAPLLGVVFERVDNVNEGRSTTRRGADHQVELKSHLTVEVSPLQSGLVALLDQIGIPVSRHSWHMVQLLYPSSIFDKLGMSDITVSKREDDFLVQAGERAESYSRRQLVKLIFGPERISDIAGDRLPVPLFTPATDHV